MAGGQWVYNEAQSRSARESSQRILQEYRFIVAEKSILDGTDVKEMKSGDWALTLFTCTKGGKQRVTLRCKGE